MEQQNNIDNFVVPDRQSFVEFLTLFRDDLKLNSDKWENKTLDDFLEAMIRYADDIEGFYNNTRSPGEQLNADIPTWGTFANILRGARVYE
jgi:hypothetical protein